MMVLIVHSPVIIVSNNRQERMAGFTRVLRRCLCQLVNLLQSRTESNLRAYEYLNSSPDDYWDAWLALEKAAAVQQNSGRDLHWHHNTTQDVLCLFPNIFPTLTARIMAEPSPRLRFLAFLSTGFVDSHRQAEMTDDEYYASLARVDPEYTALAEEDARTSAPMYFVTPQEYVSRKMAMIISKWHEDRTLHLGLISESFGWKIPILDLAIQLDERILHAKVIFASEVEQAKAYNRKARSHWIALDYEHVEHHDCVERAFHGSTRELFGNAILEFYVIEEPVLAYRNDMQVLVKQAPVSTLYYNSLRVLFNTWNTLTECDRRLVIERCRLTTWKFPTKKRPHDEEWVMGVWDVAKFPRLMEIPCFEEEEDCK